MTPPPPSPSPATSQTPEPLWRAIAALASCVLQRRSSAGHSTGSRRGVRGVAVLQDLGLQFVMDDRCFYHHGSS
eukprot:3016179-Rhodomonas_salina.2